MIHSHSLSYHTAQTQTELQQILTLQRANNPANLSEEERAKEGFVTLRHTPELLTTICGAHRHIIAKKGDMLAGYALVMLPEFREYIPEITPMFTQLNGLRWNDTPIHTLPHFMMGQICVAKDYRGQGVMRGLYAHMKTVMQPHFHCIITEVSLKNTRSMQAHEKIGFRTIDTRIASDGNEWAIVLWDWQ